MARSWRPDAPERPADLVFLGTRRGSPPDWRTRLTRACCEAGRREAADSPLHLLQQSRSPTRSISGRYSMASEVVPTHRVNAAPRARSIAVRKVPVVTKKTVMPGDEGQQGDEQAYPAQPRPGDLPAHHGRARGGGEQRDQQAIAQSSLSVVGNANRIRRWRTTPLTRPKRARRNTHRDHHRAGRASRIPRRGSRLALPDTR
jgi:hypothetical protein